MHNPESYETPVAVTKLLSAWGGGSACTEERPPVKAREFLKVSEARRQFLSGKMSLRWWYNQIDSGRLPHYRVGGAVLLTPSDIEQFIESSFQPPREQEPRATAALPEAPAQVPPQAPKSRGKKPSAGGGLRFFR